MDLAPRPGYDPFDREPTAEEARVEEALAHISVTGYRGMSEVEVFAALGAPDETLVAAQNRLARDSVRELGTGTVVALLPKPDVN